MKNASGSSKSQMLPSFLPLPASFFKVLPLPQTFNCFHRYRFHTPALCFMKNTSTSSSSKSQMLPSLLCFQLLSLKCFRFHKNVTASTSLVLSEPLS